MLKTSEPTTKKPSSLIFNSFTLNPKGNSLKINELFKVPFRGFRGFSIFGVSSNNILKS
jgi:hypothetical protein